MSMIVILLMYMFLVKSQRSESFIDLIVTCLDIINYVCFILLCVNSLFVKLMRTV
jgi:hypothetical protein